MGFLRGCFQGVSVGEDPRSLYWMDCDRSVLDDFWAVSFWGVCSRET